jgi:hypothetical protein
MSVGFSDGERAVRLMLFGTAVIAAMMIGPAHAACTKPVAPACAVTGSFASPADWDTCRFLMLFYKTNMEVLAKCRRDEGGDEQEGYAEFEQVLSEFTRRSREVAAPDEPEDEKAPEK